MLKLSGLSALRELGLRLVDQNWMMALDPCSVVTT